MEAAAGTPAELDALLSRLAELVAEIEALCTRAGAPAPLEVVAQHRPAVRSAMDALGTWASAFLASHPSPADLEAARVRIAAPIRAWSRTSPVFHAAAHLTPNFRDGSDASEAIYRNRPSGGDVPALIFDDFYLGTVSGQAVRGRPAYLANCLKREIGRFRGLGGETVRILSLGSGLSHELALLSVDHAGSRPIAVMCLDGDSTVLRASRELLDGRFPGRVTYLRTDPLGFAVGPDRPSEPYHIIYDTSLFDYLADDAATQLVTDCYGMLVPGGMLLASNLSSEVPAGERIISEWGTGWHIFRRSESDWVRIFSRTPFGTDSLGFEYAPGRGNLYALAARGADPASAT